MTSTEMRARRAQLLGQGRLILDAAAAEKREVTADENAAYEKIWAEACRLKDEADRLDQANQRRKQLDDAIADLGRSTGRPAGYDPPGATYQAGDNSPKPYSFDVKRAGDRRPRTLTLQPGTAAWHRHQPAYRQAMAEYLGTGRISAALQTDIATQGGYMVMAEQFVTELLMNVDDMRWIRKLARTFTTTAQTLGVVKRTAKMASFSWGAELSTPTADTTLAYGKRALTPHYMTGEILVSRDLLRSSLLPVEEYIRYEIARDSGELEENAFQTGTGANQPLGLFTATNDGIGTAQDVNTGNTATTIGADNLRAMKYSLKVQYRQHPSLRWLWSRSAISQISRLKDGEGQYLWRDGISDGDPDRILGIEVVESEFTPNTFTTGKYVGLLGAFFFYWIADSLEMDLLTLIEKYAESNQVAYVARRKVDGMPQIAEAFVRSKLA